MSAESNDEQKPKNPHDASFKAAMDDVRVATEFFEAYLPEHVKKLIDASTLEIQNGSFIDRELHPTASDVLYRVELNDKKHSDAYFYVLVEAQTNPDKWLPFRMLGYIVRIIDRHIAQKKADKQELECLPLVFPVIFYTGKGGYHYPIDIPSLFEYPELAVQILTKDFRFIDLNKIDDQVLMSHHWLGLLEMFMKHARARDAKNLLDSVLSVLIKPLLKEKANRYVAGMLKYLVSVGEVADVNAFLDYLRGQVIEPFPDLGDEVMTIVEQLRQQGMQQGMQQGINLGKLKGEHLLLKRLIERKFGSLAETQEKHLENLSENELLELSDRLLDAKALDELFPNLH